MAAVRVEVVLAHPDEQRVVLVELEAGATALAAVEASGLVQKNLADLRLGRFGREIAVADRVSEGDRIEILRPLVVSPMEARRLRARRRAKSDR